MNKEKLLKVWKSVFGGGKNGIFFVLIIIFIVCAIFVGGFFSRENLTNVLRQITVVTILAFVATFVIILGHINVAYGSVIALIGTITCSVMVKTNSLFLALLVGIVLGLIVGSINGIIITAFNIPAFIMTLAMTTVARGAILLYTNANPIIGMDKSFSFIGQGYIGIIPIPVFILLVLFIISWILLNKTVFGRHLYAVGGNINAASASGIKVKHMGTSKNSLKK